MYDNRLDFMENNHTIYLRQKGFRTDNLVVGSFKMTAQDIEDVIKDFDEEWKKALEDATTGNVTKDTTPLGPLDKGKDKVGSKRKDPVEVPPVAQKRKDPVEVPPVAQERKDAEEVPLEAPNKKKIQSLKANYRDRTKRG